MEAIALDQLVTVTGGALSSSVSTAIAGVNSAVSSLTTNNTSSNSNSLLVPVMMMAMQRKQQSVVSTPGATVVY
jgi:hypothetical protein